MTRALTPSATRRGLLQALGAACITPWPGLLLAGQADPQARRLVFVNLRGGMDGLFTVPAVGDPDFAKVRGPLAQYAEAPLALQGPFAMHPALKASHAMYQAGELAVVHAVGTAYRERSHFDAQQVLECGGTKPYQFRDGWLGRALLANRGKSVALQTAVPLVLRGARDVDTWAPSALPDPSPDLLQRLAGLYGNDETLAQALQKARDLRQGRPEEGMAGRRRDATVALATRAAEFLAQPRGPQVAVLELGGWDSHFNQDLPAGPLADTLRQLDDSLAALKKGLTSATAGDAWQRTVVIVATEFGRAVEPNGSRGTDHGNGSAMLLLGGAVQGQRVLADWPGLGKAQRFEGRDLMPTTDLRAVLKGVLGPHLGLSNAALDKDVFPGSEAVRPLSVLRA